MIKSITRASLLATLLILASDATTAFAQQKPADVDFLKQMRPLLRARCFPCHGPDAQEGELRLDRRADTFAGGESGETMIVPGNSAESAFYQRIADLGDGDRMPPEDKGKPLSKQEIALVKLWIDQGAKWPKEADKIPGSDHWAYKPVQDVKPPTVKNTAWVRNGLDNFILQRLEAQKVQPSPEADRSVLIRRLYFDLIGLPPTPAEWKKWSTDPSGDWYGRLVDSLLASPHYGERWGRRWLDGARYADSDGFEKDRPRPHAWRWRDWVVNALNADMPFDQFTIEQIAGDMLPGASTDQRVATGLHRNTLVNTEGGIDQEEDRVKRTVDRVNTMGAVWLGTTIECGECHSHKYDPFSQKEFYSLFAFFNSMDEPNVSVASEQQIAQYTKKKKVHDAALAKLQASVKQLEAKQTPKAIADILKKDVAKRSDKDLQALQKHFEKPATEYGKSLAALITHRKKAPVDPRTQYLAQAVAQRKDLRKTNVHIRGSFLTKGDEVPVATPAILPPVKPRGKTPDRLDLARWLVSGENPLTPRVTVNRIWQQYFGRGIVPSSRDFGTQGEPPSHPELLDWLAVQLRGMKWSLKDFHRLVVHSATYRQSSKLRPELTTRDPYNSWLSRQNRLRVEAEIIRDIALSTSGLLCDSLGGPCVHPAQPAGFEKLGYAGSVRWTTSKGEDRLRRGLYTFFQRTVPYPMLATFDAPDSNTTCTKRERSNTPLQALTIWNDPVFFECAQALGRRIVAETPAETTAARTKHAFALCLGRTPDADEMAVVAKLFAEQKTLAEKNSEAAEKVIGSTERPKDVTATELAAWVVVGRTLMNLDEYITKE